MSVATLTLKYTKFRYALKSWTIMIAGLTTNERTQFAEALKQGSTEAMTEAREDGEFVLVTTRDYCVGLVSDAANPPLVFVTKLLNLLAGLGFKIVGAPTAVYKNKTEISTYIWTLQNDNILVNI